MNSNVALTEAAFQHRWDAMEIQNVTIILMRRDVRKYLDVHLINWGVTAEALVMTLTNNVTETMIAKMAQMSVIVVS